MTHDTPAILGVGTSKYGRALAESPIRLTATAFDAALKDAGISRNLVDGIIVNTGAPKGVDYDTIADQFGLRLRYAMQGWSHGRFVVACIQTAALAVQAGLAEVVAVSYTSKQSDAAGFGGHAYPEAFIREAGGPHGEVSHYGLTAPVSGAAMSLRLYLERYQVDPLRLASVPIALRAHAALNSRAIYRDELSIADYERSPIVVDPLRRLDCSPPTDGAVVVLVGSPTAAAKIQSAPVKIVAMQGIQAGREEFVFGRPGLGVQQQSNLEFEPSAWDLAVFERSGLEQAQIQAFYTYDAFSPLVWFALERFGFCPPGEAGEFCSLERIGPGGTLPVNTNGGMLSEGHLSGFNHIVEMVLQLRGEAGARQIGRPSTMLWGSCFGDALLLTS